MIEVEDLTKVYDTTRAVDDLSFVVAPGIVTGFLGPNGAGKSTTMRLILGLDRPTEGHAQVNGRPVANHLAPLTEIGALLDAKAVHPKRSARNHLRALAATTAIPDRRVDEVLDLVGLTDVADQIAGDFSLGMAQRLGIATALLGDPETVMRTDVFRPAAGGPHPVLLQRYPYSPRDGFMAMFGRQIAAQGYAVAVQSCRGRFGSEGDFSPFHPDVDDSYDTVEWAAAQPWSNGKVGMYGVSYSGMTQWTAAIARPPHFVCIAPALCTWDWTVGGWYFSPGVLTLGLAVLWSAQMTAFEAERRGVEAPLPTFADVARLQDEGGLGDPRVMEKLFGMQPEAARPLLERRPLRDIEELRELAPWFRDWCDRPDPADPYWREISATDRAGEIDLPILHIAGWYDYFVKGGLAAYRTLVQKGSEAARRNQRLIVGPWNHNGAQVRPDADPAVWTFFDFSPDAPTMRFFARHLRGEVPDDEPAVRIYVMGDNRWRDEREWPLARTAWTPYHLHRNGHLSTDAPGEDDEPDSYVYDPADPVPGSIALGPTYGDPVDLDAVAARPDVVVYTTEPLTEDTEITGPVMVELWASTTAPSTDFTAKLIEVFPDGDAVHLCQGIVRTAADASPGTVERHEIDLAATSVVVKAGHRLRLDVSSSEYPTFEPNPNTGHRITHDGAIATATQTVFHDARRPSRVILPVIPR